jgi:hypothetical protein
MSMTHDMLSYNKLLKYERYFESPFDLLITPGLSAHQKITIIELWNARRIAFLYTHCQEGSWDMDEIFIELEICRDILNDMSYQDVFQAIGKIPAKINIYN